MKPPAAGAGGFELAPSGRAGVRALMGPIGWSRRREAPMMRHRPDLCAGRTAAGGTSALPTSGILHLGRSGEQSNRCPCADKLASMSPPASGVQGDAPQDVVL